MAGAVFPAAPATVPKGHIMQTFRKKPVEIQAVQWTGGPTAATPIIDWVLQNDGTARYHEETTAADEGNDVYTVPEHIAIDTLEGTMRATAGDWIIHGLAGEFYPCKPDIFDVTYAPADEPVETSGLSELEQYAATLIREHGINVTYLDLFADAEVHIGRPISDAEARHVYGLISRAEVVVGFPEPV